MENLTTLESTLIGILLIAGGITGWILPYDSRWNLLRLKRFARHLASDSINRVLPKVLGTLMILFGIGFILAGTLGR